MVDQRGGHDLEVHGAPSDPPAVAGGGELGEDGGVAFVNRVSEEHAERLATDMFLGTGDRVRETELRMLPHEMDRRAFGQLVEMLELAVRSRAVEIGIAVEVV